MESGGPYRQLLSHVRETAVLQSIEELLNWDQRTQMPSGGAAYRADQITLLNGMIHQRQTDPRVGDWLAELKTTVAESDDVEVTSNVREISRQYEKEKQIPLRLVEELSKVRVHAHEAWIQARESNRFSDFAPHLESLVKLLREKTEAIGFQTDAYDVLIDDYEPNAKAVEIEGVFQGLKRELVPLIAQIRASHFLPDKSIIERQFPVGDQEKFGVTAAKAIGFDFEAGRLDVTHHPFCCTVGPRDCRITTRYNERHFNSAFFGILHESGHGLYEQGLRAEQFGLPAGEYCSLGIHESQSRLWENMVGRSRDFWSHFFQPAQKAFPKALDDVDLDSFVGAINVVEPSLIRVEADEATYSLHIIIRFEIERALFAGDLSVADLPEAWNSKYEQYLGLRPQNDADGVLQDVHWSEGLFGYFPTYALGNLYAAQFFRGAEKELGALGPQFSAGEFQPLLDWLTRNVYEVGRSRTATEILADATGESLSHEPLIDYLREKYSAIYRL